MLLPDNIVISCCQLPLPDNIVISVSYPSLRTLSPPNTPPKSYIETSPPFKLNLYLVFYYSYHSLYVNILLSLFISHYFSLFLIISHYFSLFLIISHYFSLFPIISHYFSSFLLPPINHSVKIVILK
jgi:hypothetical protein